VQLPAQTSAPKNGVGFLAWFWFVVVSAAKNGVPQQTQRRCFERKALFKSDRRKDKKPKKNLKNQKIHTRKR